MRSMHGLAAVFVATLLYAGASHAAGVSGSYKLTLTFPGSSDKETGCIVLTKGANKAPYTEFGKASFPAAAYKGTFALYQQKLTIILIGLDNIVLTATLSGTKLINGTETEFSSTGRTKGVVYKTLTFTGARQTAVCR